jgi:hypothetical protein
MTITCAKCGRPQPLTDDDVAAFYPRFFCLTCGSKLEFTVAEAKVLELRRANDRTRTLAKEELNKVPQGELRKVVKTSDANSGGGG